MLAAVSRALRQWIERHAIRLNLDDPPDRLAPLDRLLDGKRIALVGENNHWIHEKYPYRLIVARWLHRHGWRILCEELAWTDGWRIDRYLRTGDATELDRVGTFGYQGAKRPDRDDGPTGILAGLDNTHPSEAFRAEGGRFVRALRELEGIRFFGIDVDYEPGAGYELATALIGTTPPPHRLDRVAGETLDEEIDRLERALAGVERAADDLRASLGVESARDYRRAVRTLWLSHRYVRAIRDAPTYEALRPAMALRERAMCEHADHALAAIEGSKAAFFAHNRHLAKDDGQFRGKTPGAGPGGDTEPSLGTYLTRRRQADVFSIWCLEDRGEYIPTIAGDGRIQSVRGTLNAELARVGDVLILPTGADDPASPLHDDCEIVSLHGVRYRTPIAHQADAIFFIREVTPMKSDV
jgi:erythromycin esterase-like protein